MGMPTFTDITELYIEMMMKSFCLFVFACCAAVPLIAQPDLSASWTGKAVKNGQPMGFTLNLYDSGRFLMAYDLNPNELSVKGAWSFADGQLSFKNSDGILILKRLVGRPGPKQATLTFKHTKGTIRFGRISGPFVLMGWDEGVAAVVVNHEEQ